MEKETTMQSEHKMICNKITSDFESKLNSLNQEKDNEIEKLHAKIAQLQQQFSESLISFEKHENAISAKENEKEVNCDLAVKTFEYTPMYIFI